MSIIIRRPWTRQPQTYQPTDPRFGVRRYVVGSVVPPGLSSVVADGFFPYVGASGKAIEITEDGVNVSSAYSENRIVLGAARKPSSATFVVVAQRNSDREIINGFGTLISTRNTGAEPNFFQVALTSSYASAGSKNKVFATTTTGTLRGMWVNGTKQSSADASDNVAPLGVPICIVISASGIDGSDYTWLGYKTSLWFLAKMSVYLVAELPLQSESVCRDLSFAPWQLFAPQVQRIWTPAAASTYTLGTPTYVPGSITSSGFRPRIPVTVA